MDQWSEVRNADPMKDYEAKLNRASQKKEDWIGKNIHVTYSGSWPDVLARACHPEEEAWPDGLLIGTESPENIFSREE